MCIKQVHYRHSCTFTKGSGKFLKFTLETSLNIRKIIFIFHIQLYPHEPFHWSRSLESYASKSFSNSEHLRALTLTSVFTAKLAGTMSCYSDGISQSNGWKNWWINRLQRPLWNMEDHKWQFQDLQLALDNNTCPVIIHTDSTGSFQVLQHTEPRESVATAASVKSTSCLSLDSKSHWIRRDWDWARSSK